MMILRTGEKAVMPYGCYEDETEALKIIVEKLVACKRYVTAVRTNI